MQADLQAGNHQEDEPEAFDPRTSPRARFLRQGREVWQDTARHYPNQVVVSPDGQHLAYFHGNNLVAGPFNSLREIDEETQRAQGGPVWGRGQVVPPAVEDETTTAEQQPQGAPVWTADSRYVLYATLGGALKRYDLQANKLETLPLRGSQPVPLPVDAPLANGRESLLFVRGQPAVKVALPGAEPAADLAELVVGNLANRTICVLVPARAVRYRNPAVTPDGKLLAVWGGMRSAGQDACLYRLLLLDLTQPKADFAELAIPATAEPGQLAWTADGKALIYTRRLAAPLPPDAWAWSLRGLPNDEHLFEWDVAAGKETRLSRGGAIGASSVDRQNNIYYLAWKPDGAGNTQHLRSVSLKAARAFVTAEPEAPPRTAAAWSGLLDKLGEELPPAAKGPMPALTAEQVGKLAERFARLYQEQFGEAAPTTAGGLHRLAREVGAVDLPLPARRQMTLVLTALVGEYLRKAHGTVWHLTDRPGATHDNPPASPFAMAILLFNGLDLAEQLNKYQGLTFLDHLDSHRHSAAGRTLVLTNDPATAQAAVDRLTDPDLVRGTDQLRQGQHQEGERTLLALLAKPAHQANAHLTLVVGQLLLEHGRTQALEKVMRKACGQDPPGAPKFNLLGLALLERQPRQAIDAFKRALRCDLHYGPAYLNLAQAYRQANDTPAAIACLRRYLELSPDDPLAADAGQRLAVLAGKP